MIDSAALHRAADRIAAEAGTEPMDALATAIARFILESDLFDETGEPVRFQASQAMGYGAMLGWLARDELEGA